MTVRRLDNVLSFHSIRQCAMVKIDVEGSSKSNRGWPEFLSRAQRRIICMEYSMMGRETWKPIEGIEQLLSFGCLMYRSTEDKGSDIPSRLVGCSLGDLPKHDNFYFFSPEASNRYSEVVHGQHKLLWPTVKNHSA